MKDLFRNIASHISVWTGTATVFLGAILIVGVWATTGPLFHFSDTWQLVINTGTTIITFLMVFLIQNTQNRDGKAVQIKLDELIRATKGARNRYVGLEDLSDSDLAELDNEFKLLAQNSSTIHAMKKLHAKIEAEQHSRTHPHHSLADASAAVMHMLHHTEPEAVPVRDSSNDK
jgi:low affinity Fe/Cu permease